MILQAWTDRPIITGNLFNPAFTCEVLRECIKGYMSETSQNFPFALSILVLPFVLPERYRITLPRTKATTMHSWLNNNEHLKVELDKHVKGLIRFSKEAIMFGVIHDVLRIDDQGNIEALGKKTKASLASDDANDCLSKALIWGKVLSRAGDSFTIYSLLGIKP